MNPTIIHQTEDYAILNKPAGLSVHPDGKTQEKTLVDFILKKFPQTEGVGEDMETENGNIKRPGIVHRLDKETSGAIIIALHERAYKHFKSLFKKRNVQKIYHLFAYGNMKEEWKTISTPIGKSKKDFRRKAVGDAARGEMREAETFIKVIKRGETSGEKYFFAEARPKTGRTHQIRVHMQSIQSPIVADRLYSKKKKILGFKRLALHARSVKFKDLTGQEVIFEADYPDDFASALSQTE